MTSRDREHVGPPGEHRQDDPPRDRSQRSLVALALIAPLAGLGAGLVGALFQLALEQVGQLRDALINLVGGWSVGGLVLVMALAATAAAVAAWLVRRVAPAAAGSGIPRVMSVLDGKAPPAPPRIIPVKFLGGTLAIGAGLALGLEGPSVQMGAGIAYQTGRLFRLCWADCRVLLAAGAGAGFAIAFNAPIAGAVFVLELLVNRLEVRVAIAALAASAVAIWGGRVLIGNAPDDAVVHLTEPGFVEMPLFVVLGIAAGLAGILYNRSLLMGLRTAERLTALPVELRAASVGAAVGMIAWFAPALVGGGEVLVERALAGTGTLAVLPLLFLFRLGLIACSVASGTPGGLLVPFLALGAELGLWLGKLCALALPGMATEPRGFAVVGMAALFTAIVRAPLTAIVLVTEMTANVTMLLPMIIACWLALLVPTLFGEGAILDTLKARLPAEAEPGGRT
jgi:chloride channel protein, CIC family